VIFVSRGGQFQNPNFVENEKRVWESQDHRICDKLFGFARGQGKWPSQIFSRSDVFEWVAVSDWKGFITIRIDRPIPKRIAKEFSKLNTDFDLSLFSNSTTIKVLNNDWVETHCQPKKALEDELRIISEKTELGMVVIVHDSLR